MTNYWDREHNGYTIRVHHDPDPSDMNPRDDDVHFLWLGFPHRNYVFGDEQVDPERLELDCGACHGSCWIESDDLNMTVECEECAGHGYLPVESLDQLVSWCRKEHDALVVRLTSVTDHSGLYFNIGEPRDRWDSGVCGVLLFTKHHEELWGNTDWTEDDIAKQMSREMDEYTSWSNGDCYGVEVLDPDGASIEGPVWGLIGDEWAEQTVDEMRSWIDTLPPFVPAPPEARPITLTVDEANVVLLALGPGGVTADEDTIQTIARKIMEAIP